MRYRTTEQHKKYWRNRKIDWQKHYSDTWNHPHRQFIVWALESFPWVSLWEVGCGSAPNLIKITKSLQGKQLGGSDINADAIATARTTFKGGKFHVESSEDMLLSDKAVDVTLSDAHLIYVGPRKIKAVLHEMVRITRNQIVLCEFHSTSFWKRLWLRMRNGYHAHDFVRLLEEAGCYDIQKVKFPKEVWDSEHWNDFGYILIAKVPSK